MMGPQARAFLKGEGKAWLERNKDKLTPKDDPILKAIEDNKLKPERVLEIGCANGWRLDIIKERYGCDIAGVDPGIEIPTTQPHLYRGVADALPIFGKTFDLIIYGWCLYLCDPRDYFYIAAMGDSYLKEDGHIIIYDFYSDYPKKKKYKHKEGLYSYKMDFSKLWLWNPAYVMLVRQVIDDETSLIILQKRDPLTMFEIQS